jgi:hypothetical protein
VVKEVVEEIAGRKSKSSLEEGGQHHDLVGVRSGNVFIYGRPPLSHNTLREKVFPHDLVNLLPIDEGGLELLRV